MDINDPNMIDEELPSVKNFMQNESNLPSINDFISTNEDEDLSSCDEFVEITEKKVIEEDSHQLVDSEDNSTKIIISLIESLRNSIPEVKSYDEDLYDLMNRIEEVRKDIPEVKDYDEQISELQESIQEVKSKNFPDFRWIASTFTTIEEDYDNLNSNYDKLNSLLARYKGNFDLEISNIAESIDISKFESDTNFKKVNEEFVTKIDETKKIIDARLKETSKNITSIKKEYKNSDKEIREEIKKEYLRLKEDVSKSLKNLKHSDSSLNDKIDQVNSCFETLKSEIENLPEVKCYDEEIKDVNDSVSTVKNLVKILENKLNKKTSIIDKLNEKISSIEESILVSNESEKIQEDPLTPLDQNFATLSDLSNHYRLFINRIQQQLTSLGGGGETRLEFLDDVDRNSVKVDGKYLQYQASTGKFIGADASGGGGGSIAGINTTGTSIFNNLNVTGVSTITGNTFFQSNVHLGDNDQLRLGDSNEFKVIHRAAGDSTITSSGAVYVGSTAKVNIASGYNTNFMARFTPAGSAELYHNYVKKFETTASGINVTGHTETDTLRVSGVSTFQSHVHLGDDDELRIGDGNDLKLWHNGSNSIINDEGVGDLYLGGNSSVNITNAALSEFKAKFITDGAVELYHDASKKFETTGAGVTVFGTTESQQLNVSGISTFQGNVHLGDNDRLRIGDGNDLELYHDGTDDLIRSSGTTLKITGTRVVVNNAANNANQAVFTAGGSVALYHNASKKFETTASGINVTGHTETDTLNVSGISTFQNNIKLTTDNKRLIFGNGDDLEIFHNGSDNYIVSNTGSFNIKSPAFKYLNASDSTGRVKLFYGNSARFETTGIGVTIINGTSDTATITGPSNLIIDPAVVGDNTGIVRIKGDLFVDGTTTQINSTSLEIADFVVGIASTATTDLLADGAGIKIGPNNTFLYEHNGGTNPSLKSSENLNVASGKVYQIAETERLSADTLSVGTGATVHSPASNTLTLGTNGTERLRITSAGLVGIGTDNPVEILDVLTPAGGRIQFDKSGSIGSRILFANADGTVRAKINNFGGSNETLQLDAPSKIDLAINGAEKVRLDANGRLLVGTLSSSGDHILEVNSGTDNEGIKVVSTDAGSYIRFADNSTTAQIRLGAVGNDFKIDVNASERLRIDSNGDVGIGIADPQERLHVARIVMITGNTPQIRLNANDSDASDDDRTMLGQATGNGHFVNSAVDNDTILRGTATGNLLFGIGTAEKFRITSAGNIGIGENNPSSILHVKKTGDPNIIQENSANNSLDRNNTYSFQYSDGEGAFVKATRPSSGSKTDTYLAFGSGGSTERVRISSSGNVGINESNPAYTLDLGESNSTIRLVAGHNGTALRVGAGGGGNDVTLIRVDGSSENDGHDGESDSAMYGFSLKYMGSRSGNSNSLSVFSDNQQATQVEAVTVFQNGTIGINKTFPSERLDVGGTTKTEQLNVTGVSTFTSDVSFGSTITFGDNDQIIMGDGPDLKLYHDGSNSYVEDTGTGALIMKGSTVRFRSTTNENMLSASQNGAISLYHDNNVKLETTASGIDVTGHTETDTLRVSGVSTFTGTTNHTFTNITRSSNGVVLQLRNTSTANNAHVDQRFVIDGNSRAGFRGQINGANLGGLLRFYTAADTQVLTERAVIDHQGRFGINVTSPQKTLDVGGGGQFDGDLEVTGDVKLTTDNKKLIFGDNDDLEIFHNGVSNYIVGNTGSITIKSPSFGYFLGRGSDGKVRLFHGNSTRFETTGYGVTVFGTTQTQQLNVSGITTLNSLQVETFSTFNGNTKHFDGKYANFGNSTDLQIVHDGANSVIQNATGQFFIDNNASGGDLFLRANDNVVIRIDGNDTVLTAQTGGIDVTGHTETDTLNVSGISTFANAISVAETIQHTGDTNTSISFPSNDYIRLTTSNSSRLNATPNGYILLGTNSEPSGGDAHARNARLVIVGRIGNAADSGRLNLQRGSAASNGSSIGSISFTDSSNNAYARIETIADAAPGTDDFPGAIVFSTTPDGSASPTERLRIESNGRVCINRTTSQSGGQLSLDYTNGVTAGLAIKDTQTSGTGIVLHVVNGSGSIIGGISQDQSSTSFNTSSDHRLKENVVNLDGAIDRVKQLAPKRFNFIADADTTVDGFLAHEAQVVVPEAVTGTHNEVDDDGNAVMQGIDQSKLVPLLTAALQEAISKIETLETKVAALEGN